MCTITLGALAQVQDLGRCWCTPAGWFFPGSDSPTSLIRIFQKHPSDAFISLDKIHVLSVVLKMKSKHLLESYLTLPAFPSSSLPVPFHTVSASPTVSHPLLVRGTLT